MQTSYMWNTSDQTHIYLDINIINNQTTGTQVTPSLQFSDTRNNIFLKNPQDYYLTIARFELNTNTLPLFAPQVQLGQSDPNLTIYSVTLTYEYNSVVYEQQTYVSWVPQNLNAPVPLPPLVFQDYSSPYYECFTYNHWITCVNNALIECFNDLKTQVIDAGGTLPTDNILFIQLNPSDCTCALFADQAGYSSNNPSLTNPIKFYMNYVMYNLFGSFEADNFGTINVTNGKNEQILIYSQNDTNLFEFATYTACEMVQEYACTPVWNVVKSIVFTSPQGLPINPTLRSTPRVFNTESNLIDSGNNANVENIISDFQVPLVKGNEYKPMVLYVPNGFYRLFDLKDSPPLNELYINCYWCDKWGNNHPLLLASGSGCSMKLLFRLKTLGV